MAKVIGVHQLFLKEGVRGGDVEAFFREEFQPAWADVSGLKVTLCRGDRGQRKGEYIFIFECESEGVRDRLFPEEGESDVMKQKQEIVRRFSAFGASEFTDYVEL